MLERVVDKGESQTYKYEYVKDCGSISTIYQKTKLKPLDVFVGPLYFLSL